MQIEDFPKQVSRERLTAIEAGLPVKMVRVLMRDYGFTIGELAQVLGPRRTLERRLEANERLNVEESERLARLMHVLDLSMEIFKDRARVRRWLSKGKRMFNNRIPLDLMRTEAGGRLLEEELLQLKWGFFA